MRNPYEILGVREGASKEEISKAYKTQAKKYHPDQYGANPLKDLAEDKMKEINEAYSYLIKNSNEASSNNSSYSNSYNSSQGSSSAYSDIRMDINNGNMNSAEDKLKRMGTRDAEWHYLNGLVALRKGWYDEALSGLSNACRLDPTNLEYRDALNRINQNNDAYRGSYRNQRNGSPDFCSICATIWCMDSCCDCCAVGC